jgi:hypothetical protein
VPCYRLNCCSTLPITPQLNAASDVESVIGGVVCAFKILEALPTSSACKHCQSTVSCSTLCSNADAACYTVMGYILRGLTVICSHLQGRGRGDCS